MNRIWALFVIPAILSVWTPDSLKADEELAGQLGKLSSDVIPDSERKAAREMVRDDLRRRFQEANRRSSAAWSEIDTRVAWEAFAEPRIGKLKESLGVFPEPINPVRSRVTGEIKGEGFRVQNLVFESRPGLWVTANLYLPENAPESMPGIILCHSHHRPKEHGELQDMGMTWARKGCAVLVPDHLGHGERRQHPFASAADYPEEFRVSRQDYYFRYDTAIQLHLAGESLIGWMAWDLMRGVDYLLGRTDIDPEKIFLLGAVAGGGDPAAVAAAIDDRIAAVVPFNFGGPQPETRFPLPDDVETSFNYAGSGGWESTRNLRRSASDGFLPWVIVGSIAPRRLIFAHEFNWDRPRDPVWKRLQTIYGFYEKPEHLAFTHGKGELRGRPPEASHCTHIGRFHRQLIHPAFEKWFGISVRESDEFSDHREPSELQCAMTRDREEGVPGKLVSLLPEIVGVRPLLEIPSFRNLSPASQRRHLNQVLGEVDPAKPSLGRVEETENFGTGYALSRIRLEVDRGIVLPVLLFRPPAEGKGAPVVVAVAQGGKEGFLAGRSGEIAHLLESGIAVCLPDLRGTGETREGGSRGRQTADTGLSSSELMLGGTMVGARLRDLRSVIRYLESREDLDVKRLGIWGDSFAEPNDGVAEIRMPRGISGRPNQSEPLGGMLALLAGIYEPNVTAVGVNGGLITFRSVLDSPFVLVPHDVVVPGLLKVADLPGLAAALPDGRVRLDNLVDESNRRLPDEWIVERYPLAEIGGRESLIEWMAELLNE